MNERNWMEFKVLMIDIKPENEILGIEDSDRNIRRMSIDLNDVVAYTELAQDDEFGSVVMVHLSGGLEVAIAVDYDLFKTYIGNLSGNIKLSDV